MFQYIRRLLRILQVNVQQLLQRIFLFSVFRFEYQHPSGACRLLLTGQLGRQLLKGNALLFAQDLLDPRADLRAAELGLLSGGCGSPQKPCFGDQSHPLPAVQRAIGDLILLEKLLFGDQVFLHGVNSFRNIVTSAS